MLCACSSGGADGDADLTLSGDSGISFTGAVDSSDGSGSDAATSSMTATTEPTDPTLDSGSSDTGEPLPPFECEPQVADSPVLSGLVLFDPADPHPGDTLTVIVRATNGLGRPDAPPMILNASGANGDAQHASQTIEGGEAIYYYALPDVALGDICLLGTIDGAPEVAGKVTVTPRPPGPPIGDGIFKVVANHQWTCGEEPSNGNELDVYVRDENGVGIPQAVVDVAWADSTDEATIHNGENPPFTEITTDGNGYAKAFNFWPISDNGLFVVKLSVRGAASDIATEITTGWWEDDLMGCSYCGTATVNVWGHWSYTVEFQRDPTATEICVVENDHAGMTACGDPRHVHHHPDVRACYTPTTR